MKTLINNSPVTLKKHLTLGIAFTVITACDSTETTLENEFPATAYIKHNEVYNPESVIPAQCYTKTEGNKNPCYVCHQTYTDGRPNLMNDGVLQGSYDFSDIGLTNSWKNLFKDRRSYIETVSDQEIMDWVNTDNYSPLIKHLESSDQWQGEVPKLTGLAQAASAFDQDGHAKDGSHWVTYNYKPLPSAFWPTNGSTGDAMIRLPKPFRELNNEFSKVIYTLNLSLTEMAIKNLESIEIAPTNEKLLKTDLDGDGKLTEHTTLLVKHNHYLGDAKEIAVADMLYPQGTEFLHTVRYIGIDNQNEIYNAPRMKEVRYMRKIQMRSKQSLAMPYYREAKEKAFGNMPTTISMGDKGITNGFGWLLNAYIEDEHGALRQQNDQELAFCNGCHKTVGTTIDQTFSFARKVEGRAGWTYFNLKAMQDTPTLGEQQGEYLTYFQRVKGGDEFRQNTEMLEKWFLEDGSVNVSAVNAANSLYDLITPSAERARQLNKAYRAIVEEQSYIFGRDTVITPAKNVFKEVDNQVAPLAPENRYKWDIRLDWQQPTSTRSVASHP